MYIRRKEPAPRAFAAFTKSALRYCRKPLRTIRAKRGTDMIPRAMMVFRSPGPKIEMIMRAIRTPGNAICASMNRMMTSSIQPPK